MAPGYGSRVSASGAFSCNNRANLVQAKVADIFFAAEIEPLMAPMLEVNDWLGVEAVAFKPYEKQSGAGAVRPRDAA